jgi:hypothetical protein
MAARPGQGPARPNRAAARRDGDPEKLGTEFKRSRGVLHAAPDPEGEDRLLADYDDAMEVAFAEMEHAFLISDGDWPQRMRTALERLLTLAARNPEQTRLCTIGVFEAGQDGLERCDVWMARFVGLCQSGYALSGGDAATPHRLAPPISAGAIFELIRSHASDDRLDQLPDALPTAILVVLAPVLGRDAALRLADAPSSA